MRALCLILFLVTACSDQGGGLGSSSCELDASTSGAVTWSSRESPACLIPFGGDTGIWMVYGLISEEIMRFEIDVPEIREGETGTFSASVQVWLDLDTRWETNRCSVTISEHAWNGEEDEFSRTFIALGEGSCSEPAVDRAMTSMVTIDPFAFRFPAHWTP